MTDAIIFDIDGTLANIEHRLHYIKGPKKDYNAFFNAMSNDEPVSDVVWLAERLANSQLEDVDLLFGYDASDLYFHIIVVSGRPDSHYWKTRAWLFRHGIEPEAIYMRRAGDHRPDDVVKREILQQIKNDDYNVRMVFDDRQRVVDMWRDEGITCAQVAQWDENTSKHGFADGETSVTVMVGPSGAGKSTYVVDHNLDLYQGKHAFLSSDIIRYQMTGNWQDQSVNDEVFSYMRSMAKTRLEHGLPVVIDATNLRRKDRIVWPTLAHTIAPNTKVQYVVINRPMDKKYEDAGWRTELPFDLIAKHEQTFQSQLKDILAGDYFPNVEVVDKRETK